MRTRPDKHLFGFTLIEVLVTIALFGIVSLGFARGFSVHIASNTANEQRAGAVMAVNQVLDQLRVLDPAAMPAAGTDAARTVTLGPLTYQVYITYCNPNTYCISNSVRAIHAEAKLKGTTKYAVDTIFSQLR